jgi:hypothetical protein
MEPVRHSSQHPDRPVLITEAPVNVDDEYNLRRKKYLIMMMIRALCIIGAATTFNFSGWLAAGFVAAALVLPWAAVLIANNRPPKQAVRFRRFLPGAFHNHELTAASAAGPYRSEPDSGRQDAGRPDTSADPEAADRPEHSEPFIIDI